MNSAERTKNYVERRISTSSFTASRTITLGMCKDRSTWTSDCRRFDDPDNDRSVRKHSGRNPKITKSILESGNYHTAQSVLLRQGHGDQDLQERTTSFCCERRVVVEHVDPLRPTSTLRFQICGDMRAPGTVRNAANSHSEVFKAHYEQVPAECSRRVPVPDPVTGRWKRPRPEHAEGSAQPVKDPSDEEDNIPQTSKRQATSAATPAKMSTSCGTLDELADRPRKLPRKRSCTGQLFAETRRPPQKQIRV